VGGATANAPGRDHAEFLRRQRRELPSGVDAAIVASVLAEAEGSRQVTLLASGSEVSIAMAAREALAKDDIRAAIASMPCWELFKCQQNEYRERVLGTAPRVGVEAAAEFGSVRPALLSG
jgi:transketolase